MNPIQADIQTAQLIPQLPKPIHMTEVPRLTPENRTGSVTSEPLACPRCRSILAPKLEHGVEIDVCPLCQGVWLDRNELDQLLAAALWEVDRYASKISDRAIEPPGRSVETMNEVFFGFKNNFGKFLGRLRQRR